MYIRQNFNLGHLHGLQHQQEHLIKTKRTDNNSKDHTPHTLDLSLHEMLFGQPISYFLLHTKMLPRCETSDLCYLSTCQQPSKTGPCWFHPKIKWWLKTSSLPIQKPPGKGIILTFGWWNSYESVGKLIVSSSLWRPTLEVKRKCLIDGGQCEPIKNVLWTLDSLILSRHQ